MIPIGRSETAFVAYRLWHTLPVGACPFITGVGVCSLVCTILLLLGSLLSSLVSLGLELPLLSFIPCLGLHQRCIAACSSFTVAVLTIFSVGARLENLLLPVAC